MGALGGGEHSLFFMLQVKAMRVWADLVLPWNIERHWAVLWLFKAPGLTNVVRKLGINCNQLQCWTDG